MPFDAPLPLGGIFNITVTPFSTDGAIDLRALANSAERIIALGYDGLLIGGTYGEFPAMSADERAELFRRVFELVHGRVPVMLGTAASDRARDARSYPSRDEARRLSNGDCAIRVRGH